MRKDHAEQQIQSILEMLQQGSGRQISHVEVAADLSVKITFIGEDASKVLRELPVGEFQKTVKPGRQT